MRTTIPIALAAHYLKDCTTVCTCLKVTRRDTVVLGFTNLDVAIEVGGVTYEPGLDVSGLVSTESLAVDNLELSILPDDATVPESDLLADRWNYAAFQVFDVNYMAPSDGTDVRKHGNAGEVQLARGQYVVEFRGISQALQQAQGIVTSKTCRVRLGSAKCTKDLTAFTHSSTVTAVTSAQIFTDSARTEAADHFGEGEVRFTGGDNDGVSRKVKAFSGGQFTLSLPLPFPVQVGDTFTAIAGCRKRFEEDCRDKFANAINFQGEPHLPGVDQVSKPAEAST